MGLFFAFVYESQWRVEGEIGLVSYGGESVQNWMTEGEMRVSTAQGGWVTG